MALAGGLVDEVPGFARPGLGGFYQVNGTVKRLGVPGFHRVELRWKGSMSLYRATISDPATGEYTIPYLGNYATSTVLTVFDTDWRGPQPPVNAAISDQPVYELMP